jgi:hypothetical protein
VRETLRVLHAWPEQEQQKRHEQYRISALVLVSVIWEDRSITPVAIAAFGSRVCSPLSNKGREWPIWADCALAAMLKAARRHGHHIATCTVRAVSISAMAASFLVQHKHNSARVGLLKSPADKTLKTPALLIPTMHGHCFYNDNSAMQHWQNPQDGLGVAISGVQMCGSTCCCRTVITGIGLLIGLVRHISYLISSSVCAELVERLHFQSWNQLVEWHPC